MRHNCFSPTLEIDGLDAGYGKARILEALCLRVEAGEVVALMGRNGAGKSTTLKSVLGMTQHFRGDIRFQGVSLLGQPLHEIVQKGVAWVPEDRRIFTDLTVLENLQVALDASGNNQRLSGSQWNLSSVHALFPNLAGMPNRLAGQISGGEQQMLSVARALLTHPILVLLDEPSEGVAPIIVQQMVHAVRAMKAAGVAVLLSEQNWHFASQIADRACLIEKGRSVWQGDVNTLRHDATLRRNVLGV